MIHDDDDDNNNNSKTMLLLLFSLGGDVEFEENDVPVLHDVILPLLSHFALSLHRRLASQFLEIVERHHFRTDKAAFKVRVNGTRRLGEGKG